MTTATHTRELFDLEKQYWEASKNADAQALERLTADDFTFVMSEGIMGFSRQQFADMMAKEGGKITGYKLDESSLKMHEITPDVTLVSYQSHIEYNDGGKQKGDSYTTSIWARRGGSWRCAAVTDTPITKK